MSQTHSPKLAPTPVVAAGSLSPLVLRVCSVPPASLPLPRSPELLPVTFPRQPRLVPWNPQGPIALCPQVFSQGPLSPHSLWGDRTQSRPSCMVAKTVFPQVHKVTGHPHSPPMPQCLLVRIYPLAPFPQLHTPGSPKACPVYEQLSPASLNMQFLSMELMQGEDPFWEEQPSLFHFFGGYSAPSFPPVQVPLVLGPSIYSTMLPPFPTM